MPRLSTFIHHEYLCWAGLVVGTADYPMIRRALFSPGGPPSPADLVGQCVKAGRTEMTQDLWNPAWAGLGEQGRKMQGSVSGGMEVSAPQTVSEGNLWQGNQGLERPRTME